MRVSEKWKFYGIHTKTRTPHHFITITIGIDHCLDIIYLFVIVVRSNYYTVPIQSVKHVWLLVLLFQLSAGLDHCFIAIDQLWKIDLGIRIICSVSSM